jgi:hypothetical protein
MKKVIDNRANISILLLMSLIVLRMGCGIAAGITFYVGKANPHEKCGNADLDKSRDVGFTDFAILAQYWLESNCARPNDCGDADLVRNNSIDIADLSLFAQNWLCELSKTINVDLNIDNLWMYQNLPTSAISNLTANVAITDDPLSNSSYSYQWEFDLPFDVSIGPQTLNGGESGDAFWNFAANDCSQPEGISDSGQVFRIIVTVTGNEQGNTGTAEQEFGIALLGDVNNDSRVDVADRSIINAFWRFGPIGKFTLRDCDIYCDGVVDIVDRTLANILWRGALCQNKITSPCPLR